MPKTPQGTIRSRNSLSKASATCSPVQLSQLRTFFLARGGSSNGFLLKWPHEHNSTATGFLLSSGSGTFGSATTSADQLIGTGDGGTVDFQLVKRYTDAAGTLTRNITKPISGTVKVQSNGVDLTEGADFTVNYATGVVTLASAPTSGHLVKAGFDFYFPVRFGAETDRQLVEQPGGMMVSRAGGAIELIEDIDPPTFDEDVNHGGRKLVTMTANITLDAFTLLVQLDPPRLDLRHIKNFIDNFQQVAGTQMNIADIFFIFIIAKRAERFLQDHLGKTDNSVQRCS